MSRSAILTRRGLLAASGGVALAFAARSGVAGPEPQATRKLVVILARGGMDGLSVAPPLNDARYLELRRGLAVTEPLPFDGDFGLHPALPTVARLAAAGQVRLAPAVGTDYAGRSHFEAQDVLEAGDLRATDSGWLNRAVSALGGDPSAGLAVGGASPLILRGRVRTASWSPGRSAEPDGRLVTVLRDLYHQDPMLGPLFEQGVAGADFLEEALGGSGGGAVRTPREIGADVGRLMDAAGGPSIVALSAEGFDTHAAQGGRDGRMARALTRLDGLVAGLEEGLSPASWGRTAVVVVTEFGRTAAVNGSGGTDHGRASAALLLGGAVKAGGLIGDWPGLAAAGLSDGRDLAPTLDMRALFKGVLRDHLSLDVRTIGTLVFPETEALAPIDGLLAA